LKEIGHARCWQYSPSLQAIVLALSPLASLWPALRATQVSVRESLAYE
jgi:hypothetical protein